jgi:hypothetical protein
MRNLPHNQNSHSVERYVRIIVLCAFPIIIVAWLVAVLIFVLRASQHGILISNGLAIAFITVTTTAPVSSFQDSPKVVILTASL